MIIIISQVGKYPGETVTGGDFKWTRTGVRVLGDQ
jgi:hypothetical protein